MLAFLIVENGSKGGLLCSFFLLEMGLDRPVFSWYESGDFGFAVGDHAEGRRLDSTGGKALFQLAPEKGAEPVTDHAIENASGLLGIDEVHIDCAGVVEGFGDGTLRDFVKDDATDWNTLDVGCFEEVPGDGLTFAVGVGCEVYGAGAFSGLGKVLNGFLLVLRDLVKGLKVVGDVDAEAVLGKVPDMAKGSLHAEVLAQDLAYGPGLGGGFHDY